MDPVSKLGRALAVIRRAASGKQPNGAAQRQSAPRSDGPPPQASTDAQLRAEIARRLRAVAPNDPNRRDTSVRVFLEQVLLREFGAQALGSPRFQNAVRDVQQVMDADPGVRAELDSLIEELAYAGGRPAA